MIPIKATTTQKILAILIKYQNEFLTESYNLRRGRVPHMVLANITPRYSARIFELRRRGIEIETDRRRRFNNYRLITKAKFIDPIACRLTVQHGEKIGSFRPIAKKVNYKLNGGEQLSLVD